MKRITLSEAVMILAVIALLFIAFTYPEQDYQQIPISMVNGGH